MLKTRKLTRTAVTYTEWFVISFIISFVSQMYWTKLPSTDWLLAILVSIVIVCLHYLWMSRNRKNSYLYYPITMGVLCAILMQGSLGHWYKTWQPSVIKFHQDIKISGRVTDVDVKTHYVRLMFNVDSINNSELLKEVKIRLSWYQTEIIPNKNDVMAFTAKLRPPSGLANPHSFDFEKWLLANNVIATGYIRTKHSVTITPQAPSVRQRLLTEIEQYQLTNQKWIKALALGERRELKRDDWHLLQGTGTAHLFAISGLHLSMVVLFAIVIGVSFARLLVVVRWILSSFCWRIDKYINKEQINYRYMIYIVITITCFGYAYLSGWQLPVVRAWLAVLVVCTLIMLRLHISTARVFLWVCMVLLVIFPYSLYGYSLWLTLSALVLIMLWQWRYHNRANTRWQSVLLALKFQGFISCLMLPIIALNYSMISWLTVPINWLIIPVIMFVLLPLCLLSVALMLLNLAVAQYLLRLVDRVFDEVLRLLHAIPIDTFITYTPHINSNLWLCMMVGCFIFCLPPFIYQKRIVAIWCLPLLGGFTFSDNSEDMWYLHVFDAGQGTAIALQRNKHIMLIDTGAAYSDNTSIASRVIMPWLKAINVDAIDLLLISHNDNDHAGGMKHLLDSINVNHIRRADDCRSGESFMWQSFNIKTLWPEASRPELSKNNLSCVYRIDNANISLLLPGDIEQAAELRLLKNIRNSQYTDRPISIKSSILIAPHHGSKTSSLPAFVRAINPQHVIFTNGIHNRWGFPHKEVVDRYDSIGATIWETASNGYIRFAISDAGSITSIKTYRQDINARWYKHN